MVAFLNSIFIDGVFYYFLHAIGVVASVISYIYYHGDFKLDFLGILATWFALYETITFIKTKEMNEKVIKQLLYTVFWCFLFCVVVYRVYNLG